MYCSSLFWLLFCLPDCCSWGRSALPSHEDRNLTAKESAEEIASFFSMISQEFTPIKEDNFPLEVQSKLENDICEHPAIREYEVYEKMKAAKKTDSVPGDIPKTILKEFLQELATPVTTIIKQAVKSHTWPKVYKKEIYLPIKKTPSPESKDDICGIGHLNSWKGLSWTGSGPISCHI